MPGSRKSRVEFEERAELLDFLLEVSAAASETLDLDVLLENVARIVRQVIPHELFAILLYSEKRQGLRIRYALGHRPEVVENLVIPLGEGITGAAAASRAPVLVGDVRADQRYLNALDAVRSELAVPMVVQQKLVGVLDLQSSRPNAFSKRDSALLQLIAGRVGAAIVNATLFRRVERQGRIQRTLALLGQEFSSILHLDALLDKIAKSIRTLINYDAFIILAVDEEKRVMRNMFSLRYDQRVQLESLPMGQGLTGTAAQTRQPVLARDTLADPRYIESHPGIRSEVAIPLIVKDRVIGVMDLESERVGYFTEDHVRTLSLIAPQIAISIENARLYAEVEQREKTMQKDLEAARQLQEILLPRQAPPIPGLSAGIRVRAARQITGDVYDFFEYDDEHAMLAFGDSSGKGVSAALYGALFSGLLRSVAPRQRTPATLLKELNATLLERKVEARFIALLVMLWRAGERTFTIANAGSTTPLVCRRGAILTPEAAGIPVGLLENVEYDEVRFEAEPGDVLLLYSDGVQDQTNPQGDVYGEVRLAGLLQEIYQLPPQAIADRIVDDLREFRETQPEHDDQTVIALKVE
jgi:sigma-B regulation protein RsbU (phosphoserine phosphatase)